MAQYQILRRHEHDASLELSELQEGLLADPATLAPKYFYDELGCALYGAICQLPEYYPTRTEIGIFQQHRQDIADAIGVGKQFIDLGAGDCCKAQSWIPFISPSRYVAVDIAGPEIDRALAKMSNDFPEVMMLGVVTDFSRRLDLDGALGPEPATFFYPGSSIGNFKPADALGFLQRIFALCKKSPGGGLLIGVDAKKGKAELDAAYDDALGVTAAFNRNALLHLNRRFGFDFALAGYLHRGFYNESEGRVEMHLESVRDQRVDLGGRERLFRAGDRIHTENSYKYSATDFESLLRSAGFTSLRHWSNDAEAFHVFHAA